MNIKYLFTYILIINLYAVFIMHLDKYKSKHNKWRISEKNLFITAILGGSLGILSGMYFFRHKTKHKKFVYGIPFIIILQLILCFKIVQHFCL